MPGSMQVEFRVKVRCCYLSHELKSSSLTPQSPGGSGFRNNFWNEQNLRS